MRALACLLVLSVPATVFAADEDVLDCRVAEGGIECAVPVREGRLLYCLAEDAAGEPVANSTVSAGTGVAVFNTLVPEDLDRIAAVTCRTE